MKQCSKCKDWKDESEFSKQKRKKDGLSYYCKKCSIEYRIQWEKDNPQKLKNYYYKKRFGISIEDYNTMLELQNGVCAICGQPETALDFKTEKPKNLAVDHNHRTRIVRGLLCQRCNTALGNFQDNIDYLKKSIKYLEAD